MRPLILAVRKTLEKYDMVQPGDRVVVAVSGGADSVALLHALWEIRNDYHLSLIVAHLDHGLRPEGEKETLWVGKMAGKLGIPFHRDRVDVRSFQKERSLTLQEAARELRYSFLQGVLRKTRAGKIALGHTADDQAESLIIRFLRGSGTRGLSGIPPVREGIYIRPLIETWREEVEDYLGARKIAYLTDPSNQSLQYLRNRVRHELIPLLQQYNPRIRQNLVQMADLFRAEEEFWTKHLEEKFPGIVRSRRKGTLSLDIPSLVRQPIPVRLRCLRRAVETVQGNLRRVSLSHIWAIQALTEGPEPNKTLRLPQGLAVTRAYNVLNLTLSQEQGAPFEYSVPGPGYVEIPEIGRGMRFEVQSRKRKVLFEESPNVALLDFDDLDFPLTIRTVCPGDRFQPLGMEGEKKVKDLFMDCKIPALHRKRVPLLFQGERLLWVTGIRIDHRARLKPETRRILRVELI
ncbi:MAG: tRNA lysidine(34) synthetase TilS [Syntrophaceae bacterium]|nr:tRNA lysidine(34) synthetase TilS [Syntrophaceae bacterium]